MRMGMGGGMGVRWVFEAEVEVDGGPERLVVVISLLLVSLSLASSSFRSSSSNTVAGPTGSSLLSLPARSSLSLLLFGFRFVSLLLSLFVFRY